MNRYQHLLTAVLVLGLGTIAAPAQTNLDNSTTVDREGQVVLGENLTATDVSTVSNLRPDRPERKQLPPEVAARIQDFRRDARRYLEKQEALRKQLEGANDKERAIIRRQVEHLRREWLERAREMRKELRDRQAELMDQMPDYREVIDSARNAALEESQQATRPGRDR